MRATTHSGVPPARLKDNYTTPRTACGMRAGSSMRAMAVALLFVLPPIHAVATSPPSTATGPVCRITLSGSDSTDGSNWTDQSMDLQTALATSDCSEIWLAAGDYTPTSTGNREVSFDVRPGIAVYGGFVGNESQRDERDPVIHITTLSGDLNGDDGADFANNGENSYHVMVIDGTTAAGNVTVTTVVDGLTVNGGNANGSSATPNSWGGGLFCNGGVSGKECSPLFRNVTFKDNSALNGGAMFNYGNSGGTSSPRLSNVSFIHNYAANFGGAMFNFGSSGTSNPNLSNVTFSGNTTAGSGGAMVNSGDNGTSSPRLANVTFSGNSAGQFGGVMFNNGSSGGATSPILSNVIVWGNTVPVGPGVVNISATPSIDHSVIEGGCPAGSTCNNVITTAPLLGALADNGGATQTMLPGGGSSAIDAGNPVTCRTMDQRGVARPQGSSCDIGAVEVEIDRITTGACRVDTSKPAPGDGFSWASAYPDLQSALRDHSCDEVWVAAGVYTPTSTGDRTVSFDVRPGVAVYGGFAGGESERDERDPANYSATLSGDLDGNDGAGFANNGDNSYHAMVLDGTTAAGNITASTVLDGFTISGGNANGGTEIDERGGSLHCNGSNNGNECSPTINNVTFSDNSATLGGAMFNDGSDGGISSPSLANVTFSGNRVINGNGGAMHNFGPGGTSSPSFVNVTFSNNQARLSGGAIYNNGLSGGVSSPSLVNVTFSGNSVESGYGGAMYNTGGNGGTSSPTLNNVILWDNTNLSGTSGAEIYNISATSTVNDSVLQGSCPTGSTCTNVRDANPLLGPLQDNGGATPTMLPGAGSSAIDVGNPATCAATDQRGITRPQGAACDIGAVEVVQLVLGVSVSGAGSVSADATPSPNSGAISNCTSASGACSAFYAANDTVTLNASADNGQHFEAWGGDCSGAGTSTSVTLDADKNCSATFAANTHSVGGTVSGLAGSGLMLRLNGGDDLSILGNGGFTFSGALDFGSPYAVIVFAQPSTPAQTCTVSNASGTLADANITDVVVDCSTQTHTVSAAVGGGEGAITPMTQIVNDGSTALLTLMANPNWHILTISGCGGALSGTSYTTDVITADCTVIANFAIDTFVVSAAVSGGNGTISPTSITSGYGSTPVFTLTPDPGSVVASVSGCGGTLSGNSYTTAPIIEPCAVTARFAEALVVPAQLPTLDWRMLLLLAGLLGTIAALRVRHS